MAVTNPMTLNHRAAAEAVGCKLEALDDGSGTLFAGDDLYRIEEQDGCAVIQSEEADAESVTVIVEGFKANPLVYYWESSNVLFDDAFEERAVFGLPDLADGQGAVVVVTLVQPDDEAKHCAHLEVMVEACRPEMLGETLEKVARNVEDHRAGRHAFALSNALSQSRFVDGKSVLGEQLDTAVDEATKTMSEVLAKQGPRRSWVVFGVYPDYPEGGTWLQFAYADSAQKAEADARRRMKRFLIEERDYEPERANELIDESELTHICEGRGLAEDLVGFATNERNC